MADHKNDLQYRALLAELHARSITTLDALRQPSSADLYQALFFTLQGYIGGYVLQGRSCINARGERTPGNWAKASYLVGAYGASWEELRDMLMLHVFEKLPKILANPLEQQANYTYKVVTNRLNDLCKQAPPADMVFLSLDEERSHGLEQGLRLEDCIADPFFFEDALVARDAAEEARLAKLTLIRHEIAVLARKPGQVLVRLAEAYLGWKPRVIVTLILREGAEAACKQVTEQLAACYGLSAVEVFGPLPVPLDKSLCFDLDDPDKVRAKVYNLAHQAGKRLEQHPLRREDLYAAA